MGTITLECNSSAERELHLLSIKASHRRVGLGRLLIALTLGAVSASTRAW